jgi:cell division inhibitor SepF
VGLLRNALIYLGFVEDELSDDMSTYNEPTSVRLVPNERRVQQEAGGSLASVHRLPVRNQLGHVHILKPREYGDVQQIGDQLKASQPVIVNLEGVERELFRRVVAFTCGLVYGLDGSVKRLSKGVYLVAPGQMEVSSTSLVGEKSLGF